MREFLKSTRFKILLAFVAFLIGIMIYAVTKGGYAVSGASFINTATKPFRFVSNSVSMKIEGIADKLHNADQYYEENQKLKAQIGELNKQLTEYDDLKEEVSTQRKVQQYFEGKGDENSLWIRDGLYRLIGNVLFIEDPRQPEMYHPRIDAFQEPVFEALSLEERDAYMHLYNHFFFQRHSQLWGQTGYHRLLSVFGNSRMLVCAEDLGMLPDCVAPVLDALRILTLEIQQMPKQSGVEFCHLDANPVRSLATISTHDMPPLRLWWEENLERTQRFWTTMLQKQGQAPEHLPAHVAEEIIARHLYSPSMLCILSLQDWLSMDKDLWAKNPREERINTPSNPFNRWQYRMHLTIEQLLKEERFNQKLKTMVTRSKR